MEEKEMIRIKKNLIFNEVAPEFLIGRFQYVEKKYGKSDRELLEEYYKCHPVTTKTNTRRYVERFFEWVKENYPEEI